MTSVRTHGSAATRALGGALAELLRPGDIVLLVGGLGAGKTTLVQGMASGLGYGGDVTSPTFTLRHTYGGRLDLVHVDLWRLEQRSEILDLALEEELDEGAAVVVEWGEGAEDILGDRALVVRLEPAGDDEREISFEARGPWGDRCNEIEQVLQQSGPPS